MFTVAKQRAADAGKQPVATLTTLDNLSTGG